MESDAALQGDVSDGAEVSASENQQETLAEMSENNVTNNETAAAIDSNGGALNSSNVLSLELGSLDPPDAEAPELLEQGEEEMDIDDTTGGVTDESAYIGDNCLSTSATDNSPQDQLEPLMKDHLDEMEGGDSQEESPEGMPMGSGLGDGVPDVHDDESSTMDDDIGGGEGAASSDDINEMSGAGQDPISTALKFADADASELDGAADALQGPETLPILTMTSNGSALLTSNLLQGDDANASMASATAASSEESEGDTPGPVNTSGAPPLPPTDAAHALATLASAALHHHEQAETEETKPQNDEDTWYTVAIVRGTTFTVQNYISDPNVDLSNLSLESMPDLTGYPLTPLEHGTAYKFRIAAINSCGRGDFSEESAFKTCLPGFPGAPSAIKISKSVEGAHLSWEPPQVAAEGIFEYSVYLAVRSNTQPKEAAKSQLAFVRVYCGKANTCIVPQSSLSAAHVDSSTKPAIIFRIAARNEKGYGPATQVRWLQDLKATGVKRAGESRVPGASPVKQTKAIH